MTTTKTITHDSATCTAGPDEGQCSMRIWADLISTDESLDRVAKSAATIRARRAALLERADAESPTEGAVALADAHLQAESWFQQLPNNAMQDAAVLELAGEIEGVIGEYLARRQEQA